MCAIRLSPAKVVFASSPANLIGTGPADNGRNPIRPNIYLNAIRQFVYSFDWIFYIYLLSILVSFVIESRRVFFGWPSRDMTRKKKKKITKFDNFTSAVRGVFI